MREALTYDDILLSPRASALLPAATSLATRLTADIKLRLPIVSAAMDTVTEAQIAIALARAGGIGIIHRNLSVSEQVREVQIVKRSAHGVVTNPITLKPDTKLREAIAEMKLHSVSSFPIVTTTDELVGIVTNRDLRFVADELDKPVSAVMTKKLITVANAISLHDARDIFKAHKIEQLIIMDSHKHLKGLICLKDLLNEEKYPRSTKDKDGRLRVGAACGTGDRELERIAELVAAELDVLVIDTAHGHHQHVLKLLAAIKKQFPRLAVIAGNVATGEACKALIEHGADGIKVGIGAGSICTTRVVTGVGVPQVTALCDVLAVAVPAKIPVIADGGIRFSGDIAKALALGACSVMIGSLFAGTSEAPGELFYHKDAAYKAYRGMGSLGAMQKGSKERYFQKNSNENELIPEGIEGSVPHKGPLAEVLHQLVGGVRSAMGYVGAEDLQALHKRALFVRTTHAGRIESHVHDVQMVKEAPNYKQTTSF